MILSQYTRITDDTLTKLSSYNLRNLIHGLPDGNAIKDGTPIDIWGEIEAAEPGTTHLYGYHTRRIIAHTRHGITWVAQGQRLSGDDVRIDVLTLRFGGMLYQARVKDSSTSAIRREYRDAIPYGQRVVAFVMWTLAVSLANGETAPHDIPAIMRKAGKPRIDALKRWVTAAMPDDYSDETREAAIARAKVPYNVELRNRSRMRYPPARMATLIKGTFPGHEEGVAPRCNRLVSYDGGMFCTDRGATIPLTVNEAISVVDGHYALTTRYGNLEWFTVSGNWYARVGCHTFSEVHLREFLELPPVEVVPMDVDPLSATVASLHERIDEITSERNALASECRAEIERQVQAQLTPEMHYDERCELRSAIAAPLTAELEARKAELEARKVAITCEAMKPYWREYFGDDDYHDRCAATTTSADLQAVLYAEYNTQVLRYQTAWMAEMRSTTTDREEHAARIERELAEIERKRQSALGRSVYEGFLRSIEALNVRDNNGKLILISANNDAK